jgi:hypothetical protein
VKIYRITYTNAKGRDCERWYGTQADARAWYKTLCEKHERFNVDQPVLVEVPTDKPGLLHWLNQRSFHKEEGV